MSEYVTAKDLKAWDMLGGTDFRPNHTHAKREPKPAKVSPEQQHLPTKKEYKTRVTRVNMVQAVEKALIVVQATLGYDLSANSSHSARFKRIQGWHTFCRCIQLICPDFTVTGISTAVVVENAPSRETLAHMFQCAKENPHGDVQLRRMLGI